MSSHTKFSIAKDLSPYINGDISWLSFNNRLLEESTDPTTPLYERIYFLARYAHKIDEFYRTRVLQLRRQELSGSNKFLEDPKQILDIIHDSVASQFKKVRNLLNNSILPELRKNGIILAYNKDEIPESFKPSIRTYFKNKVRPLLNPVMIQNSSQALLDDGKLYLLLKLMHKESKALNYALVNIPNDQLPRFNSKTLDGKIYFVFLDDIIRINLELIFEDYTTSEAFSFKYSHPAKQYSTAGESANGNFSGTGKFSHLMYDDKMPLDMLNSLFESGINEQDITPAYRYLDLSDLAHLPNPKSPGLSYESLAPLKITALENTSIFNAIERQDVLLHFPYHSSEYIAKYFYETSVHPDVDEVFATYCIGDDNSLITNALITAAKNEKKVKIFVNAANKDLLKNQQIKQMKLAGAKIYYDPESSIHFNAFLVVKRNSSGKRKAFGYLSTGRIDEHLAMTHADHVLLTSHKGITRELKSIFQQLIKKGERGRFRHLLLLNKNLTGQLSNLIQQEIDNVKTGAPGNILIKVNHLDDSRIIEKLVEASMAGVDVIILVRGICCLRPGIGPFSSNVRVYRLVDRYIEHSRVFIFHNKGRKKVYLGSLDFTKHSFDHQHEIIFPIVDSTLRKQLIRTLAFQLNDNTKLRILDSELNNNVILRKNERPRIRAQVHIYEWLKGPEDYGRG